MSTGRKGPLSPQNISDFVDHRDDMALELSTFRVLLGNGWWANHGGFYRDPVQDKFRQFDVQGGLELRKNPNTPFLPTTGIRVAAECKNLSPEAPIVVSRMPRTENESYHCLLKRITDRDNAKAVKEVRVIRSTAVDPKPYHLALQSESQSSSIRKIRRPKLQTILMRNGRRRFHHVPPRSLKHT
jgi:hypothetical protein